MSLTKAQKAANAANAAADNGASADVRLAAHVAPFASASIAALVSYETVRGSLSNAYRSQLCAMALAFPLATAAEIMADFRDANPGAKEAGTPKVLASQCGRALREGSTLADIRRDTADVDVADLTTEQFAEVVAVAAAILADAVNAVKNAPKVAKVTAKEPDDTAGEPVGGRDAVDPLDLASRIMADIATLRAMDTDDARLALAMIAETFAETVEAEVKIDLAA